MPSSAQNGIGEANEDKLCRRCGENVALFEIRQDSLCDECFVRFVKTKVVKRMEAFRGHRQEQRRRRKYLLPISLGPSSAALLHVLDDHCQRQIDRSGQANYELHCLYVSDGSNADYATMEDMKRKYPRYTFASKPVMGAADIISSRTSVSDVSQKDIEGRPVDSSTESEVDIASLLSSPSSRSDVAQISRTKTITQAARELECDGILWGDTTTRLAEKVLAETAKGRGASLPWLVNDGQNSDGISFLYPMKDLLKKEVLLFVHSQSIPTNGSASDTRSRSGPTPVKNSTIDSLMTEYFQSVEENYPSIVANVVRTSGKLQSAGSAPAATACGLCSMPLESTQESVDSNEPRLCYGCNRLMRGEIHKTA